METDVSGLGHCGVLVAIEIVAGGLARGGTRGDGGALGWGGFWG